MGAWQANERRKVCLQVQAPIISKYGFEGSWKGVLESVAAYTIFLKESETKRPETPANFRSISMLAEFLVKPELQQALMASHLEDWRRGMREGGTSEETITYICDVLETLLEQRARREGK